MQEKAYNVEYLEYHIPSFNCKNEHDKYQGI